MTANEPKTLEDAIALSKQAMSVAVSFEAGITQANALARESAETSLAVRQEIAELRGAVGQLADIVTRMGEAVNRASETSNRTNHTVQTVSGVVDQLRNEVNTKVDRNQAWAIAQDGIAFWWNRGVNYETPQLLNLIHNRVRRFFEKNTTIDVSKVPTNSDDKVRL